MVGSPRAPSIKAQSFSALLDADPSPQGSKLHAEPQPWVTGCQLDRGRISVVMFQNVQRIFLRRWPHDRREPPLRVMPWRFRDRHI